MSQLRYIDKCRHGTWHLMLSEISPDGEILEEQPFRWTCRSWRHEGECRTFRASVDFARIDSAVSDGADWVYCVLTFAKNEWPDWRDQYRCSGPYWSALRNRLQREFGRFRYIQTWERHESGGIHVNVVIDSQSFASHCYRALKKPFKQERWFNDWLEYHAGCVGFGWVHWAQPLRVGENSGLARYLVKLANELIGHGKSHQVPFDAPKHFRRIRASQNTLPKKLPSSYTGRLVMLPFPGEETKPPVQSGEECSPLELDRIHVPLDADLYLHPLPGLD